MAENVGAAALRSICEYVNCLISRIPNRAVLMYHRTFCSGLTLLIALNISPNQDLTPHRYV
jgi:hypothetical protein